MNIITLSFQDYENKGKISVKDVFIANKLGMFHSQYEIFLTNFFLIIVDLFQQNIQKMFLTEGVPVFLDKNIVHVEKMFFLNA